MVHVRAPMGVHFHFALLCLTCKIWRGRGVNTLNGGTALSQLRPNQGGPQAIPDIPHAPPASKGMWCTSGSPWESMSTLPYSALLAKSGFGGAYTHSMGVLHSLNFH
jgi:hypothetical protein